MTSMQTAAKSENLPSAWALPGRGLFAIALLVAHLPFGLKYVRWLWAFDHYHFVPIVAVGCGWLFWQRALWQPLKKKSLSLRVSVYSLIGLSLLILLLATAGVPWLGWLALVLAIGAALLAYTDKDTGHTLWHIWVPVLLTLRLPLGRDIALIAWLQTTTSALSSSVLDAFGVMHHMAGNVLQLPGREFFVEEACSGVQSVFTLLFLSAFYSAMERRSLIRTIALMASAFFWAGFMNVARVTSIALAHEWYDIDLSSGWTHELIGYCALVAAFLLLVSTDRLLHFLFSPIVDQAGASEYVNRFVRGWNWLVGLGYATESDDVRKSRRKKKPARLFTPIPTAIAILFVCVGGAQAAMMFAKSDSKAVQVVQTHLVDENHVNFAEGTWSSAEFTQQERAMNSQWGRFSDTWQLSSPTGACTVDLAYPFSEWHDLTICYRGAGWEVINKEVVRDESGWPSVCFEIINPSKEYGFVAYSQFDSDGKGLGPATEEIGAGLADRLQQISRAFSSQAAKRGILQAQIQMLFDQPVSPEQRRILIEKHFATRVQLRDAVVAQFPEVQE